MATILCSVKRFANMWITATQRPIAPPIVTEIDPLGGAVVYPAAEEPDQPTDRASEIVKRKLTDTD
jgi:hypothetical protein